MENKTVLQTIVELLIQIFAKNKDKILENVEKAAVSEVSKPETPVVLHETIDWSNPECKISKYFTVKEMIYLPTWKRMAIETDGLNDQVKTDLIDLAKSMDIVREYFGKAVNVHVTYRPTAYNVAIKGALHSAHTDGAAMDFDIIGMSCDDARKQINDGNMLEAWNMRMEENDGGNWIHLDRRALSPGGHRFFKP